MAKSYLMYNISKLPNDPLWNIIVKNSVLIVFRFIVTNSIYLYNSLVLWRIKFQNKYIYDIVITPVN